MEKIALLLLCIALNPSLRIEGASVQTITAQTPAETDTGGPKESAESVNKITQYFMDYAQFVKPSPSRESSSDGGGAYEVDHTQSPEFIEMVIDAQIENGMEPTGVADDKLAKAVGNVSRCGISDPPSDPDAPGAFTVKAMWESKYEPTNDFYLLTYSFVENDKVPEALTQKEVEEGILSAMCLWESNSNLRFKNAGDEEMLADITISFQQSDHGDFYSFDGKGGTLAHAFYPENGRLHFDQQESWYLARKGGEDYYKKDVFTVAAHEIGHNIGLMHSKRSKALMAPIYRYSGSFDDYKLPKDDIRGIEKMYGTRKDSNPVNEAGTACRDLYEKFGVTGKDVEEPKGVEPISRPTAVIICKDDAQFVKYCPIWASRGYCSNPKHVKTLHRRCKKTCEFCPKEIPDKKPEKEDEEEVGKLSSSICGIPKFDSVAVDFDGRNYLEMYFFKDDYYFESSVQLEAEANSSFTMLDDSETLSGVLRWRIDPKTIKSRSYKYKQPDLFEKSDGMSALVTARLWYLTFEESGEVHQYSRGTPTKHSLLSYQIQELFPGYPHKSIDTAFVETLDDLEKTQVFSLFKKNKIWQFKENKTVTADALKQPLQFVPVEGMTSVDIGKWHGVPACDIQSVFKYNGVPYFLKGNMFWPAVDTEQQIARDITYNFLRCWHNAPDVGHIPTKCDAVSSKQGGGENGALSKPVSSLALILPILFVRILSS